MATYFCGRAVLCGGLAAVLAVAAPAAPQEKATTAVETTTVETTATATQGLKMVRNLDYGGSANVRQMLDLYLKLRHFFDEHLLDGPSVVTDGPVDIRDEG